MDPNNYKKIFTSSVFKNKNTSKKLLEYLFEKTISNKEITEEIIAKEFFKRDDFLSLDDTIVRVNIFKLRKLLEAYYNSDGKYDVDIITIPKGSYSLFFVDKPKETFQKNDKNLLKTLFIIIFLLSIGWCLTLAYLFFVNHKTERKHPLWGQFKKGSNVEIVLLNPYFMLAKDSVAKKAFVVRDWLVNKESDKLPDYYKKNNKNIKFSKLEFPIFNPTNVYGLPKLYKSLLQENVTEVAIRPIDKYHPKESFNQEAIFMGSIKDFRNMDAFMVNTSIKIIDNSSSIIVKDSIQYDYISKTKYNSYIDYGIIINKKNISGNSTLLISATMDRGVNGVLDKVNSQEFIDQIIERYGYFPTQFEMVVKVEGYKFSNMSEELIYFEELK